MPMKMLGWVLWSAGLLLAAGCAHTPPPAAAGGAANPVGSSIHQPAGAEHVQTYDLHRSGKPDVWVYSVTTQDASGRPVELAPQNAMILDTLGWAQYKAGQVETAQQTLERSIAIQPLSANHLHLAAVYTDRAMPGQVREHLQQAARLARETNDPQTLEQASRLLEQLGE